VYRVEWRYFRASLLEDMAVRQDSQPRYVHLQTWLIRNNFISYGTGYSGKYLHVTDVD
jgi:hypothetical protein